MRFTLDTEAIRHRVRRAAWKFFGGWHKDMRCRCFGCGAPLNRTEQRYYGNSCERCEMVFQHKWEGVLGDEMWVGQRLAKQSPAPGSEAKEPWPLGWPPLPVKDIPPPMDTVSVPRPLVMRVLGLLAQECAPCADQQCQITDNPELAITECRKQLWALLTGVDSVEVPKGASSDYADEPWQDALMERAKAAGFKRDAHGDWIVPGGLDTTELLALLSGLPLPERYTSGMEACQTEHECEWQPWCRMHGNCRRKVEQDRTAKHVAVGVMAQPKRLQAVVEEVAQGWDGCMYDAPGGEIDIGAALRKQLAELLSLATCGVDVPPAPSKEACAKCSGTDEKPWCELTQSEWCGRSNPEMVKRANGVGGTPK